MNFPHPSLFTPVIDHYLPEPQASLLNGIIFGTPLKTSKAFYEELKTVGLLHLVVLSGINITMLSAIITSLTIFLGKKSSLLITMVCIVLFIYFVGFQAPIIRAGVMGILALVGTLFGRKYTALYGFLLAGLITAIFWPQWLTTVSFQLSYGATLGIILFSSSKKTNAFMQELRPSLAAQVFTVPILFFKFHQISLIAPISNILVSFTIVPLMIFGFLTAILGKINVILGVIPAFICYCILSYILFVIHGLSKLPFAQIRF